MCKLGGECINMNDSVHRRLVYVRSDRLRPKRIGISKKMTDRAAKSCGGKEGSHFIVHTTQIGFIGDKTLRASANHVAWFQRARSSKDRSKAAVLRIYSNPRLSSGCAHCAEDSRHGIEGSETGVSLNRADAN